MLLELESLSVLDIKYLRKMKNSYRWIYKTNPVEENLNNLLLIEKVLHIKEDATANAGSVGGMGNVVSAQPSSIPGQTIGIAAGSGDIGVPLFGSSTKIPAYGIGKLINKIKGSKKLQKKLKGKNLLSYNQFLAKGK